MDTFGKVSLEPTSPGKRWGQGGHPSWILQTRLPTRLLGFVARRTLPQDLCRESAGTIPVVDEGTHPRPSFAPRQRSDLHDEHLTSKQFRRGGGRDYRRGINPETIFLCFLG